MGAGCSPAGDTDSWPYDYVPGAGDDEESWAHGLTAAMFWRHEEVAPLSS